MNKKAQELGIGKIIFFAISIFTIIIIFGVMTYGFDIATTELKTIGDLGNVNGTQAVIDTFGAFNDALAPGLRLISIAIIFGLIMFAFLSSYMIEEGHPAFIIVHIVMTVLAVVISVYLANYYETLLTGQPFSSFLLSFKVGTHILLNLPLWITVIGLISTLLLFIKISKREQSIL